MNNRNNKGRYRPNCYNAPFPFNPDLPCVETSAESFHTNSLQNQFYIPQQENCGSIGTQANLSDAENAMLGLSLLGAAAILQNNYYPDIPGNQYGSGAQGHKLEESCNYSNGFDSFAPHKYLNPRGSDTYKDGARPNEFSHYKSIPKELQPSAKAFVPKDRSSLEMADGSFDKTSVSTQQITQNSSVGESIANDSSTVHSVSHSSYEGARPKDFSNSKGVNKKYFSSNQNTHQNWQSKENRTYNNGRQVNGVSNMHKSNYGHPLSAPDENRKVSSYNGNNLDYHRNDMNYTRKCYENSYNNSYNSPANGYNKRNQTYNDHCKQDTFNLKKNEWRGSSNRNNDYSYSGSRPSNRDYYCRQQYGNNNYSYEGGNNREYYSRQQQYDRNNKKRQFNDHPSSHFSGNSKVNQERGQNKQHGNNWQQNCKPELNSFTENDTNFRQQFTRNGRSTGNWEERSKESNLCGIKAKNEASYDDKTDDSTTLQDDGKTQRENLIESLSKGVYECMVCCERIKQQHSIWSCKNCFNCFHLSCIKKWAGTSQGESGWRCPACQDQNSKVPSYFCFCKKAREPEWNRKEVPHSCGEVCGKRRKNVWCTHKCTILCHPGPCPDCSAFIKRECQCKKTTKEVRCSQIEPFVCENKCGKLLNCLVHSCEKLCHIGDCEPCAIIKEEVCFCTKEKREVLCTEETSRREQFHCDNVCGIKLLCGIHDCMENCHNGPCSICPSSLEVVTTCPCGKMNLSEYYQKKKIEGRKSCVDPIPTCGAVCGKVLKCGTPGNFHTCETECHMGPCPDCKSQTDVRCRCGYMETKIPCVELLSKADEVLCKKQCKRIRQCGRHKCGTKCCIDVDHVCPLVCGKFLKCRIHKCEDPCHRGNCQRCWETSFEELSCHCGTSVLYPPIACGTEPPACDLPCRRQQSCTHAVAHTCHPDPKCPPCTTLSSKPCFGGHMIMKSTPCYVSAMSCGSMCAKDLPCGSHVCQKVCHEGACIKGNKCTQKCSVTRPSCEHPCNNTCHKGKCPNTPCKQIVTVTCICGNRKEDMSCSENEKEYKNMTTAKLTSELHSMNSGESIDISQIFSGSTKPEKLKRLECNGECALLARNRQLALALQITNPDSRDSIMRGDGHTNLFSDSMKGEARKDLNFASTVHTALTDLVMKAKESKHKSRSHSFPPMNRDKRRFIHDYAKLFACQSMAYDEEPKKNVVVTADRLMSRLPPVGIVSVIQKELGQRKIPGPVLTRKDLRSEQNKKNGSQLKRLEKASSFEKKDKETKEQNAVIDYFDFS